MEDIEADHESDQNLTPVEVPTGALERSVLTRIVEEFILREGTDYGSEEVAFETKVQQVLRQLDEREARLYFDPSTQSVTLVARS